MGRPGWTGSLLKVCEQVSSPDPHPFSLQQKAQRPNPQPGPTAAPCPPPGFKGRHLPAEGAPFCPLPATAHPSSLPASLPPSCPLLVVLESNHKHSN